MTAFDHLRSIDGPHYSAEREAYLGEGWVVGLSFDGRADGVIHETYSFATRAEADRFVIAARGNLQ